MEATEQTRTFYRNSQFKNDLVDYQSKTLVDNINTFDQELAQKRYNDFVRQMAIDNTNLYRDELMRLVGNTKRIRDTRTSCNEREHMVVERDFGRTTSEFKRESTMRRNVERNQRFKNELLKHNKNGWLSSLIPFYNNNTHEKNIKDFDDELTRRTYENMVNQLKEDDPVKYKKEESCEDN